MSVQALTLREFRKLINHKRLDRHLDLPVVVSKDDEGNGFDRVLCEPDVIIDVEVDNDMGKTFKRALCIN